MDQSYRPVRIENLLRRSPQAWANLRGNQLYPDLFGIVRFYAHSRGTVVVTEVIGLPDTQHVCSSPVFGFHIHGGSDCRGNSDDPFADVGMHYNPLSCPHPHHSGDLPPLFGANGYAFSACLTDRFTVDEIIGKTVIIHDSPDDFRTQPSGNSENKIACGEIIGYFRPRR